LRGCVNDTESIKRLLIAEFQFAKDQIRVRTDDDNQELFRCTQAPRISELILKGLSRVGGP
jgi:hypothetical protein